MLDFELSEEQKQLQALARDFTRKEILPAAQRADREERMPEGLLEKAFATGLLNPELPEELGGSGLSLLDEILIAEELGYGCMGVYTTLMASALGLTPILLAATPEQQRRLLAPLRERPCLLAFALSEANNGSDAAAMRTLARRDGGDFVISGSKMWISNGGEAELTVVFATTDPSQGHRSSVAIVVPRSAPGQQAHPIHHKLGQRASLTSELVFDEVRVPAENLLGEVGAGFRIAMQTLDRTRIPVAAASVGVARRARDEALRYAKERQAFGRPVADFQAIQFKLADMEIGIQSGRWLAYRAAWLADQGRPHSAEAAAAKAYCSDMAFSAANEAIQIFGGAGYVGEYPVEKLLRDVKLNQIYEGTNEIMRVIIARSLLRA